MRLRNLTPIQTAYLNDWTHRFITLPSGRRSRKTLLSMRKVLLHALRNPDHRYFHGAPTRQQAKSIFWKRLKDNTRLFWAKAPSETELYVTLLNNTEIHVIGLDKPERIEGQPWNGCHITEIGNVKETAWPENIRPVLSDTNGFAYLDGVPEGINHYYDLALYAAGGALPKTQPIKGAYSENLSDPEWAYYHWFSSDVLTPAEMAAVKMQLDERTFRQEYEGSFESYEGLAYYAFSNENLKNCEYNPLETVHIGMDFNVNPMTAVFTHIRSDDVFQFGEAYLNNSNTYEMRDYINERFKTGNVVIYPDSTGKSEHSNATQSDLAILRKAGFRVRAKESNPYQRDRIAAVNSKLRAGNARAHYFINPENCPKTINDLNKVESLPDGRLNKKQEELGLVHITDALGYLVAYLWPVRKQTFGGIAR